MDDEKQRADTTGLPIDDRPEVHEALDHSGRSAPISLEQDKEIREGLLPEDRFDDLRMRQPPERGRSRGSLPQSGSR